MSRRPNLIPTQQLNVALPLPVYTEMTLHLYSDLELRVPHSAYSRFLTDRIREYFTQTHLDLAPYVGAPTGSYVVSGSPEAMQALKQKLETL